MPMPNTAVTNVPQKFDPEKHCGAKQRGRDGVCLMLAGMRTDHVGVGRCFLHGGLTPVIHGGSSKVYPRAPIRDRIEEIKQSPDLLSLDDQIAYLRAIIERQMEVFCEQIEGFDFVVNKLNEAEAEGRIETDGAPLITADMFPKVDTALIDQLQKLVNVAYNMRFSKRFSVPVSELGSIIAQIKSAFDDVCARFNLPQEARAAFGERLMQINISRPFDPQLARAGGEARYIINADKENVA